MNSIERGPYTAVVPEDAQPGSPVVVLMGWAGATDKPLSKFSEMLAEQRIISVRCTQPIKYLFSPIPYPRRSWAISLLAFLEHEGLSPPRPLVLYAFSNGGASVVEQIHSLVDNNPRYARYRQLIAGFVFDSAPAYMHQRMANKVLEVSMPPGLTRLIAQAAFNISCWIAPMDGKRQDNFWDCMLRLDWGKPQLFLYSQDDPLCDANELAKLIEEKVRRGQRVTAHKWERSQHVAHFKVHREEYLEMLLPFLRSLWGSPAMLQSKL